MHANQNLELQHSFNLQMTIAVCANGLLSQVKRRRIWNLPVRRIQ